MFPLDFILLSNVVKWIARRMYFKFFASEYPSPVEDISEDGLGSTCKKDVYYTGTVTEIRDDYAFIDGRYTFSTSQIDRDVFIGNIVTCVINSDTRSGPLSDLTIIDILNDYDENLDATPCVNSKAHGVVVKRLDRIFTVSPGPLEFDLDRVTTKFIPEVGDLVELLVEKTEEDETRVVKIFPRGYKVITGTVTSYENDAGFINDSVVFQKHHCRPRYQPQKDDRVVMSVIRCQNGSTQFRALHVNPLADNRKTRYDNSLIPAQSFFSNLVFHPQEVICVSLEETKIIDAELCNNSDSKYDLIKLKAYTTESLIELVEPTDIVMSIKPKSKAKFKFKVCLKYVGFCSVTFDFVFEGFIFTGSLNLLAINKTNDFIVSQLEVDKKESSTNVPKVTSFPNESRSRFPQKFAKPGRHFRNPVKFFPVKLGFYELPDQILSIMKDGDRSPSVKTELVAYCPCLSSQLKQENYKIYMHCLLYLEEISQLEKVSKLELTCGFEKRNDFLILNVEEESNFTMLQAGDRILARKPWDTEGDVFEGIIWQAHHKELFIKFDRKFHDNYVSRSEYILNFSLSRSQMRLKHQAIDDIMYNLGTRWLFPDQTTFSPPLIIRVEDESEECGSASNFNSQRRNTKWNRQGSGYGNRQQKYTLESTIPVERKRFIKWFNSDLNAEQKCAVVNCLRAESRPFPYILFGPPGTGKSMTLIELCLQIYKLIPESKILLVAPSNSAADQLSLNLIGSGFVEDVDFVRLGGFRYIESGNVPDGLVKYVCLPVLNDNDSEQDDTNKINRYILSEKRIIVSTLGSIGTLRSMGFPYGYFSHYIVDEAGQVMEPENLIIASLMSKDSQIVLAGDPLQLGPVIFSSIAKRYGLHRSFLLRLMDFKPYMFDKIGFPESYGYNPKFITKLVRSYRALPKLLELISNLFYRGELKAMVNESSSREAAIYSRLKEIFPIGSEIPILFHSVAGREALEDGSFSFYNNEEVFQICTYLSQLYRLGMESHNVGIITPYIAQVRRIIQFLDSLSLEVPKIGSVEEFQGQEKDIILLSTVRSSIIIDPNVNQMTFVYSPQRINVAISRAKSVLIIVGNSTTLSNDEVWRNVVQYTVKHNSFRR